jgi:hypothetical protein
MTIPFQVFGEGSCSLSEVHVNENFGVRVAPKGQDIIVVLEVGVNENNTREK